MGAFEGLALLIPAKADDERDAVATAWEAGAGSVLRLDRFWEPPQVDRHATRLYGNDTFCLVVAQQLRLQLLSLPMTFCSPPVRPGPAGR